MALADRAGTFLFGLILVVCTLPAYLVSVTGLALLKAVPEALGPSLLKSFEEGFLESSP